MPKPINAEFRALLNTWVAYSVTFPIVFLVLLVAVLLGVTFIR